jgi:DNA-binding NarL/FixJ family response regulator
MRAIRVLLVGDAPPVRAGLRTLLPLLAEADGLALEIAGEASDGVEALRQAAAVRPDVVCLDLEMPELDGLAAAKAIKSVWPATRVVAFSVHGDAEVAERARAAGVDAFIVKGAPLQGLIRRLREEKLGTNTETVAHDRRSFGPAQTRRVNP